MAKLLSRGVIKDIADGKDYTKPVLQLIGLKKMNGRDVASDGRDRYRVMLSDSLHAYSAVMLAPQLNLLVDNKSMQLFSVIRIDRYVCNALPDNRRVIVIQDVSILKPGSKVGSIIGNPTSLPAAAIQLPQNGQGEPINAGSPQQKPAMQELSNFGVMVEGSSISTERASRTLECSICLDTFHNPKTLPCLHSYCEECLVSYAPEGTKTIKCPQCKEEVAVPQGDARKFKSNFHLKELVEEMALRKEMSEPSVTLMCNCCKNEISEAVARCMDCDQYLCSSCLAAHQRFTAMYEHVVATLDELKAGKIRPISKQKREPMCTKHPRNKAEIFCVTCEMPICHVCATLKHKSPEHECIEATEAADKRRQLATNSLGKLNGAKVLFRESSKKADLSEEVVITRASKLKQEIESSYQSVVEKAAVEKQKLLKEVDDTLKENVDKLTKYKKGVQSVTASMCDTEKQVQTMVKEMSDGDFLDLYDTVKIKVDQLSSKEPDENGLIENLDFQIKDYGKTPVILLGTITSEKTKSLFSQPSMNGDHKKSPHPVDLPFSKPKVDNDRKESPNPVEYPSFEQRKHGSKKSKKKRGKHF